MFLGGAWIRREGKNIFNPFVLSNVDCSAYAMSLGKEAYVSTAGEGDYPKVELLEEGASVVIPPGQFAYLITKEKVRIPVDKFALINMKNKLKVQGLVNVSGFHVDPGYQGKLVFAVFNAGPKSIMLRESEKTFLIWFAELGTSHGGDAYPKEGYYKISSELANNIPRQSASLSSLNSRLEKLERFRRFVLSAIGGIAIATIGGYFANTMGVFSEGEVTGGSDESPSLEQDSR
ncbi:hypothetical protein V6R97_13250 [Chromohalobacter salexigens]|uniref:dCTP deaminase domain-containing protein n=1 Tax=Chromohalobacter israelensis TaxID=141390 RepID=UPI0032E87B9C